MEDPMRGAMKITDLNGIYRGRRCFIVGNGPSLNRTDVRLLKNEVSIASNRIYIIFEKTGYRPTLYTSQDLDLIRIYGGAMSVLDGCTKLFPRDAMAHVHGDDYFEMTRPNNYSETPGFSEDASCEIFDSVTVTYTNFQLAYYMGCTQIYLIGMDYHYNREAVKALRDGNIDSDSENHFDSSYTRPGFRYGVYPQGLWDMTFLAAKNFFISKGIKVFNATDGGYLEIFQRISYNSLFGSTIR